MIARRTVWISKARHINGAVLVTKDTTSADEVKRDEKNVVMIKESVPFTIPMPIAIKISLMNALRTDPKLELQDGKIDCATVDIASPNTAKNE